MFVSNNGNIIFGSITSKNGQRSIFRWTEKGGVSQLGSLNSNNSGNVDINDASKDGSAVIGFSNTEIFGHGNAFRWTEKSGMENLTPNAGHSYASAISDDGKAVVGQMTSANGNATAFLWKENIGACSLGTLRDDNLGTSDANGISADGSTIVGDSSTNSNAMNAFMWTEKSGMVGLGTLKSDKSGNSAANAASANGSVVVGASQTDTNAMNAFRWTEKTGMVGLGTLKTDKSGYSGANFISQDGLVIVGSSDTDTIHSQQGYRWTEKSGMVGLGTLRTDNTGFSDVMDITPDASVIVGEADTDSGWNAFRWTESTGMVGLGTLKADNSGLSTASAVSDDGLIIVGAADTDDNDVHATIWKIKGKTKPVDPTQPEIIKIDVTNSNRAMSRTASRGFKILDFYQSSLNNLSQSRCQLGQDNYCVGLFTQYDHLSDNNRVATGLLSTLRLPNDSWTIGTSVNFANNTTLDKHYETRGNNQPSVSLFARYQENRNNDGFYADLSAAYLKQDVSIKLETLSNTEAGKGNATFEGYQARLSAGYGLSLTELTQIIPTVALTYKNIHRSGYTETRDAEFLAQYGRMGNKRTDIELGMSINHSLTESVQLEGKIGSSVKLNSDRDAFTGYIHYIGAYSYDKGTERTIAPYVSAGANMNITPNSTFRTTVGWQQTDYKNDSAQVGLIYSYHW